MRVMPARPDRSPTPWLARAVPGPCPRASDRRRRTRGYDCACPGRRRCWRWRAPAAPRQSSPVSWSLAAPTVPGRQIAPALPVGKAACRSRQKQLRLCSPTLARTQTGRSCGIKRTEYLHQTEQSSRSPQKPFGFLLRIGLLKIESRPYRPDRLEVDLSLGLDRYRLACARVSSSPGFAVGDAERAKVSQFHPIADRQGRDAGDEFGPDHAATARELVREGQVRDRTIHRNVDLTVPPGRQAKSGYALPRASRWPAYHRESQPPQ